MKKIKKFKKLKDFSKKKHQKVQIVDNLHEAIVEKKSKFYSLTEIKPNYFLLSIKPKYKIKFYGKIKIIVLQGEIMISGLKFEPIKEQYQEENETNLFSSEIFSAPPDNPLEICISNVIKKELNPNILNLIPESEKTGNALIIIKSIENFSSTDSNNEIISVYPSSLDYKINYLCDSILKRVKTFPKDISLKTIVVFGEKKHSKFRTIFHLINYLITNHHKISYMDLDLNSSQGLPGCIFYKSDISKILTNKPSFINDSEMKFVGERIPNNCIELFLHGIENIIELKKMEISEESHVLIVKTQDNLKEIGGVLVMDIINMIKPFFLISCGENNIYKKIMEKQQGIMSFNSNFNEITNKNYEIFIVEDELNLNIQKSKQKDQQLYSYFLNEQKKENEQNISEFFNDLPKFTVPCFLNLIRFCRKVEVPFKDQNFFSLQEKKLINIHNIQQINSIEFSLLAIYLSYEAFHFPESIYKRNCLGLCYLLSINFEKNAMNLIIPSHIEKDLICNNNIIFVKSPWLSFSNDFYKEFYKEALVFEELMLDFGEEIIKTPFISEIFEGVIGDKPYIQKISAKRHNK